MFEGSTRVYDWMMTPHRRAIEAETRRLGIPVRGALHECLSPLAQISQTVAAFEFPRKQLPPGFHHVGPLRAASHQAPARIEALPAIDPDRPFIFASLGTLQGHRFDLFKRIAKACRQLDAQLLIAHCGGLDARQAAALEAHRRTWVCAFAPQEAALARADAVVSHAGLNTAMDAVAAIRRSWRCRSPSTSRAWRRASATRAWACPPRRALRARRSWRSKLRRLFDEPGFKGRCAWLADSVRQAGGSARAASIVEHALSVDARSPAHLD